MRAKLSPLIAVGGLIASVVAGCAAEPVTDVTKPEGGKADAVTRLCQDAGEPDDCDICDVRGWYGDGECDEFCRTADSDCSTPAPTRELRQYTCTWGEFGPFGEDGNDLYDNAESVGAYEAPDEVAGLTAEQIFVAAWHLGGGYMSPDATLDEAFESVDENTFYMNEVTIGRARFDWIKAYAGDTQIGVVFEAGTTKIVGEISDGDVLTCEPAPAPEVPTPGEYACDWDTAHPFGSDVSSTEDLDGRAHHIATHSTDQRGAIGDLTLRQFFITNAVVNGLPEGAGFDDAFELADEGSFSVRGIYHERVSYTWIHFYSGDTEVGAIFRRGTEEVVAEIGDGDLLGCVATE